ncbi:MAG: recombinase RecT [Alphaproteobacteria bacterium]
MSNLVQRSSLQPRTMAEAMEFADQISKSALIPREYQGKPANTLVAIQWGMELGLAPLQALQNIAVINGKPSMYGDALLAMVRADTRCRGVKEYIEGEGDKRTAVCIIKRSHGDEIEEIKRSFSVEQAKQAGLWNKAGPWKQYPERMLQHRARGNAMRDGFADVIKGIITVEEAQDYETKDVTPPKVAVQPPKLEELMQPTPEPETPPQSEAMDAGEVFHLYIPGKLPRAFQNAEDFAVAYSAVMLKVRRAAKVSPADRRSKLHELETANQETINRLGEEFKTEMFEKRKEFNAQLSMEAKENV